jgi:hypothetical protein
VGWDKGRYYTRSKKVNGRVVREYYGAGPAAERVARRDAIERERRAAARADEQGKRAELDALDAPLAELDEMAELLAHAALVAAGFRQHKRGEWRKRRGNRRHSGHGLSDRPQGTAQAPGPRPEGR